MSLDPAGFSVVVSFAETSGKIVTREYVANPAVITTPAELAAAWALVLATPIKAMSDSVVVSYFYKQLFLESALTLPAAAENSDQALLSAKLLGKPNASGTLSIPAAKATLFTSPTGKGYDVVDVTDAIVSAFLDMFDDGGNWVFSDGDQLVKATASGKRRNVKNSSS